MAPNQGNRLSYENEDVQLIPSFEKKGKSILIAQKSESSNTVSSHVGLDFQGTVQVPSSLSMAKGSQTSSPLRLDRTKLFFRSFAM